MSLHIRCDYCFEVEQTNIYEAFQAKNYKCTKCILEEHKMNNQKTYKVSFKHIEETTYVGYVKANSEEEAYEITELDPYNIDHLQESDYQGIELHSIQVIGEDN